MPGNHYSYCTIDDNGYFIGKVFLPFSPYTRFPSTGLERTRPVLTEFAARMHGRGVRVFYAFP